MSLEENSVNPLYTSLFATIEKQRDNLFLLVSEILRNEISKYPIFIASKTQIALGKPFVMQEKPEDWNINISLLEEFAALSIVSEEHLEEFKRVYKDPEQFFCFLVISQEKEEYIFIPRTKHSLN